MPIAHDRLNLKYGVDPKSNASLEPICMDRGAGTGLRTGIKIIRLDEVKLFFRRFMWNDVK
jgi:hypothetical protein